MKIDTKKIQDAIEREYGTFEEGMREAMIGMDSPGICTSCYTIGYGIEPDVSNGPCDECGERTLMGLEMACIHSM